MGKSGDTCDGQCGPFSTVTLLVHTFFFTITEILFLVFLPRWYRGSFLVVSLRQLFTVIIFSFVSKFWFPTQWQVKRDTEDLNSHSMYSSRTLKNPQMVISLILPCSPGFSGLSAQDCKLKFCMRLFASCILRNVAHEHTR